MTTLASQEWPGRRIAVDRVNVYWTSHNMSGTRDGEVRAMPLAGGAITTIAWGGPEADRVAVAGSDVYWFTSGVAMNDATVMSAPVTGGKAVTLARHPQYEVAGLAVDDTGAYYIVQCDRVRSRNPSTEPPRAATSLDCSDGTLLHRPPTWGEPFVLASGIENSSALAIDGENVYWTERGDAPGEAHGVIMTSAGTVRS